MSRYDSVKKVEDKEIQRIGTASLPDYEDNNSDILLIAVNGDRCDQLSQEYYGTPEHWWFIATVNKLSTNHIDAGTQIRIPLTLQQAILE
tara:strand:- start:166 stop:435 length:270 start_codon:yes stop_codon:yes gene_type:complete